MRKGDESYLCSTGFTAGICNDRDSKGNAINQLINPSTGQPFLNNQIPSTMINLVSQKILGLYPLPNNGSGFTDNNYNVNVPANYDSNGFDVRGDQYFGQKLSLFGRYTYKNINQLSPTQLLIPSSNNFERVRMLVTSATYTIRPTLLNEFRFGYTGDHYGGSNPFNGQAFTNSLGLENIDQNIFFNGVTEVDFNSLTSLSVDRLTNINQSRTIEFNDNLTWIKHGHTLKFGVDTRLIRGVTPLGFFGADNYGTFAFASTFSGNDLGAALLERSNYCLSSKGLAEFCWAAINRVWRFRVAALA
jgi:hypothetical protein